MTASNLTALIVFTLTIAALQTPPESLRFVAGVWISTPAFWFVIASIVVVFAVDRVGRRSE